MADFSGMIKAIKDWAVGKFITEIPIGSSDKVGGVKADGTTTTIDSDGTIHATGGGGGEGTSDYNDLEHKPSIGGVTLAGDKTLSELGIQPKGTYLTEETDPTVPDWAKEETKPTYSKSEVGLGNVPNVTTNNQTPTFTEATERANITSGEKLSVIFGKIMKWFTDLKPHAFAAPIANLITTVAGSALDATMGKKLDDKITANTTAIEEVRSDFQNGCDTIVTGCTSYGETPVSNSPTDIVAAIKQIYTERYTAGVSATKKGTAGAAQVLEGYTFTNSSSVGEPGSMPNKTKTTNYVATASLDSANKYVKYRLPAAGYYSTGNYLYATYSTIATLIGLTAAKIVKGNTILGIAGTGGASGYYKKYSHTGWFTSATVSITDYSNYKNITASNIHIGVSSFIKENSTETAGAVTWTYDSSTGVITINSSANYQNPVFEICVVT